MTMLVTGATGSIGREVLAQLQGAGVEVRASTRDPATASLPDGIDVVAVDLAQPDTLAAALRGVDAAYLFPSFDDVEGIGRALAGSDLRRVVLLSSISTSLPDAEQQFNASRFLALERAIEASGVPFTFLRAGEFAGNIRFYAPGLDTDAVHVPFPDSHHLPLDERDIAEVAVLGLTSDGLEGGKPRLTGDELLTLREEIAAVAEAAGRPIEVVELPEQQALEEFAAQAPRPLVATMLGIWKASITDPPEPSGEVQRITGHVPRRFADWARDHADEFARG